MVEPKVLSAIGGHFAIEQLLDDVDGFRQPLVALDHARPAGRRRVRSSARPPPVQGEPPLGQQGHGVTMASAMMAGSVVARTAPSALARSSVVQDHPQAPPPQQVVRQAPPKRASQQNEADRSGGASPGAPSPVSRGQSYSAHEAQQDYLLQVVRELSQARSRRDTRGPRARPGGRAADHRPRRPPGRCRASPAQRIAGPRSRRDGHHSQGLALRAVAGELAADSHTFIVPINLRWSSRQITRAHGPSHPTA